MIGKTASRLLFSVCLILALSISAIAGCAPSGDSSDGGSDDIAGSYGAWRYGDIHSVDSPAAILALEMSVLLRERTEGRINIDYYPACQLGDWSSMLEEISVGTVDMGIATPNNAYDSRFLLDWAPYRFFTWEQAIEAYEPGGWCLEIIEDLMEEHNVKFLGYGFRGFTGVSLNECPDKLPPECVVIKIRTPPISCKYDAWQALGYLPTAIPFSEIYTAVQTGVVEGQAGGGPEQMYVVVGELTSCWVQTNDWMDNQPIGMNLDLWNSLTAEDQGILQDTVTELLWAPGGFNERQKDLQAVWLQRAADDYGVEAILLDDETLAECARVVREAVWPSLEAELGSEIYQTLLENCPPA